MSDTPPDTQRTVARLSRAALSEDWAATIVGLLLLGLILAGAVTKGLVP
jgi:hypothetical protein